MSVVTEQAWERCMKTVEELRSLAVDWGFYVTNHPDHIDDPYAFVARSSELGHTTEVFVHIAVFNTRPELDVRRVITSDLHHTRLAAMALIEGTI